MVKANFEATLFKTADKLRKNIDASEYKNVVLDLIFLKFISDSFKELYERLDTDEYSDAEDRDEYLAENVFFVPAGARWKSLQEKAKLPEIGVALDEAMDLVERENTELKHVLPKVYGKPNLDKNSLGEFASAEGKKGGQFYTPKSIVQLMADLTATLKSQMEIEQELDDEIKIQLAKIGFEL